MNKYLLNECLGWNARTWAAPLAAYLEMDKAKFDVSKTVLEVGAGRLSTLAPFFSTFCGEVVCSFYDESQRDDVVGRCDAITDKFDLSHTIKFKQINIFEHTEKYDVVVMKSVLGGLCRTDTGIDHSDVIRGICERNLTENGILITVDNGISVFDRWVSKFGARKNKWKFFKKSDFEGFDYQITFGYLSFFSLKSRLGKLGAGVETLTYYMDKLLQKITKSNPVVILNIYSK